MDCLEPILVSCFQYMVILDAYDLNNVGSTSAKYNLTCWCLDVYLSDLQPAASYLQGKILQVHQARSIPCEVPCNQTCHICTRLTVGLAELTPGL